MKYSVLLERLHNLTNGKVNITDIANIIDKPVRTLYTRGQRDTEFKPYEIKQIEQFYNVDLSKSDTENEVISNYIVGSDRIEIPYWEGLPENMKNPKIASVWFDREIIENAWGIKAESLRIVPMIGDSMTKYWYPICNGDMLIVDTLIDHIRGNGVYFGTSQNNTRFWIREMQIDMNLNIEFRSYSPSGSAQKLYTFRELEEVDFKLIGKVIKNVSFRL